jgi:glycosyltransferase involved in cell wall biosynthesis
MEQLLVNHARFGDRERFEYHAAFLLPQKDQMVGQLEDLGVSCHCLDAPSDANIGWWRRLRRLLRDLRTDVIHVHSPTPAVAARLVARSCRPRPAIVYTEHNNWGAYRRATRVANALTYPLDDRQVAVSAAAFDSVPVPLRRRLEVLHHGVDLDDVRRRGRDRAAARRELGVGDDRFVVGTVANFRPEKNYEGLLDVAVRVTAERPTTSFVSVGQGPLEAQMRERAARMGLTDDRFAFRGYEPDAVRIMAGFDAFVLASHHEGLPVAFMEARALGLPVVSTAVGGLPEMIEHDVDGLLVPPGAMAQLGDAIERLVDDPAECRRLATASAAAAARVDGRVAVRHLEDIYARAVEDLRS